MMRAPVFPLDEDDRGAALAYHNLIARLITAPPRPLRFTTEAAEAMTALRKRIFNLGQAAVAFSAAFQGFLGKMSGVAGRLAIVIHMGAGPGAGGNDISAHTVGSVEKLIFSYLLPNAREFYRAIRQGGASAEDTQKLASYILRLGKMRLTSRDLARGPLRNTKVHDINSALSPLVAGHWIEPENPFPSNREWRVNPQVQVQFAKKRAMEEERLKEARRLFDFTG
jgi:hypothetical protein